LLSILSKYLDSEDDNTDEALLRQVGITKYPEQFEFCGQVSMSFHSGIVDFSRLMFGGVVNSADFQQGYLTELVYTLLEFLNTAPLKEKAVEQCDHLRREIAGGAKKRRSTDYSQNQKNNDLVEMVLILQMELGEHEQAVDYFKSFYFASNREVTLYVLLQWLQRYGLKDLWLREYEAAAQQGVRPRDALLNKYKHLKVEGESPTLFS